MLGNLINSFIPRQRAATVQTLGHPAAGIIGWWNPDGNSSGEVVNETTALSYAAFWCGVRVIAEILASLPCILYERINESDKRRATEDYRYGLVHDSPNEEMDAYHFFEVGTAHQVIWGNSYNKIVRDGFNDPKSLELRLPDRTISKRRTDGVLVYECSDPREVIEFPDMLHGVGFSFDGIKGYSLIEKAAQSLGVALAGDKYVGASLKNGGVPSGVLDHPTKLTKSAREEYRREWEEIHGGAGKAAKLAITHGGIKYTPISMTHEAAQLDALRKFPVVEVARWLRLPLYILADLENSGVRANIEQQAIDLISYSLMPWVKRWEGALRMKLLRRDERGKLFFEFLLDSLLRGDTLTRYQAYAIERQWGFGSVNEIRARENRNGIGAKGDVYIEPLNMKPAGSNPENDDSATLPATIVHEYQKTVAATINETVDVAKQMKSAIETGFLNVHEAFNEFGAVLEKSVSSERETFGLIKQDIEQLTTSVKASVRVPEVPDDREEKLKALSKKMLQESIRVLLRIEGAEAIKAARAQMRDRSQNFLKRIDEFYFKHSAKVCDALNAHAESNVVMNLNENHVMKSRHDLLDCCDGNPDEFEARVTACVEKWQTDRVTKEAEEYHAKIYGTHSSGQ